VIECDASSARIGSVLMQNNHPIAYISQELKKSAKVSSAYEREMLVILFAIKKWRQYLVGKKFTVRTDHKRLKYLLICGYISYTTISLTLKIRKEGRMWLLMGNQEGRSRGTSITNDPCSRPSMD